jgi:uncharacterized protein
MRPLRLLVVVLAALGLLLPTAAIAAPAPDAAATARLAAGTNPGNGPPDTVPGPPSAGAAPAPMDYTTVEGLSPVRFADDEIRTDVVRLPMRDGVEIYIEITRPDVDGERFPVILEASPYHGTIASRIGDRIFPDPKDEDGANLGLTGYFAPRGYAVAMMGLRGTGRSQGCLDHMGPNDALDLAETVEWLAEQDWSTGKVGMTGHSYVGSTPMIAASMNPKGLATIVPSAGIARAYDHQFQAGVAYAGQWLGLPVAYNLLALDRHLPVGTFGSGGDNFGNDMQFFGCGLTTSSLQEGHRQVTGEYAAFHAERDHTAAATAADIPVFLIQGTYDNAVRPPAMDWFDKRRNPEDKLWYGQFDHGSASGAFTGHPNRRFAQWQFALHAWFDAHLQGRDVETGPPVEVFINGERTRAAAIRAHDRVYTDTAWPTRAQRLTLYPDVDGNGLSADRPTATDSATFRGSRVAALRSSLEFRTEPFADDTLLVGLPDLRLVASATAQNLDLIANVYEEAPDGSRREISQFAINPALRDSIAAPAPVIPGRAYTMRPPGWPMAHEVPAGHTLVLRVTTTDGDKQGLNTEDPAVSVFTGPLGTSLTLPVIPDATLHADPLAD